MRSRVSVKSFCVHEGLCVKKASVCKKCLRMFVCKSVCVTVSSHYILVSLNTLIFISSHHSSLHLRVFTYPSICVYVRLIYLHLLSFRYLHIFPSQLHILLYFCSLSGHPSSSFKFLPDILSGIWLKIEAHVLSSRLRSGSVH